MLLIAAVTLTACNGDLKDTTLTVKDGILQVANPVLNSVCKAFVNGEEVDIDDETYEITIPESAGADGKSMDVSVEVYDEAGKDLGTISATFQVIPTLTVTAADGYYDWSESAEEIKAAYPNEAVKYLVWLNNEITTQSESKIRIPSGLNTIRVRAFFSGNKQVFSRYSDPVSCNVLAAPTNPVYDGSLGAP